MLRVGSRPTSRATRGTDDWCGASQLPKSWLIAKSGRPGVEQRNRTDSLRRNLSRCLRPVGVMRLVELEDVPSSVELRWRPDDHQAAFTISSCRSSVNRTGLVGVFIVWKRGWTHAEGHHGGEADYASLQSRRGGCCGADGQDVARRVRNRARDGATCGVPARVRHRVGAVLGSPGRLRFPPSSEHPSSGIFNPAISVSAARGEPQRYSAKLTYRVTGRVGRAAPCRARAACGHGP
jgi:hypothetical protein